LKIFPSGRSFDSFSTGYRIQSMSTLMNEKQKVIQRTFALEMHKKQTDINMPVTVT
jgi:hypothetical protein